QTPGFARNLRRSGPRANAPGPPSILSLREQRSDLNVVGGAVPDAQAAGARNALEDDQGNERSNARTIDIDLQLDRCRTRTRIEDPDVIRVRTVRIRDTERIEDRVDVDVVLVASVRRGRIE